jgi:hypothetical protein
LIVENTPAISCLSNRPHRSTGDGEILDLQTIIGGTGELAGASGVWRASGTFDPETDSGESE